MRVSKTLLRLYYHTGPGTKGAGGRVYFFRLLALPPLLGAPVVVLKVVESVSPAELCAPAEW